MFFPFKKKLLTALICASFSGLSVYPAIAQTDDASMSESVGAVLTNLWLSDESFQESSVTLAPSSLACDPTGLWSLRCLMVEAARFNPSVRSKLKEVDAAQEAVTGAKWQFFPTPSITSYDYKNGTTKGTNTVASLIQPIWTGGRLLGDLNVAEGQLKVSQAVVDEARYSVALKAVSDWGSALIFAGRKAVIQVAIERLKQLEAGIKRRVDIGIGAMVDLDLVRARIEQLRGDYAQAVENEKAALISLSQLTGKDVKAIDLSPEAALVSALDLSTRSDAQVIEQVTQASFLLKRFETQATLANEQLSRAKADYFPTLSARIDYEKGSNAYNKGASEKAAYFQLNHSLGGGGLAVNAKVASSLAAKEALQETIELARRDIVSSTSADLSLYRVAAENEKGLKANLKNMRKIVESYQRMFVASRKTWLDFLNINRELMDGELRLSDARVQKLIVSARLKLNTGEYPWQNP